MSDDKVNVYNGMTVDVDDKQKVIEDVMLVPPYNSFDEFKEKISWIDHVLVYICG